GSWRVGQTSCPRVCESICSQPTRALRGSGQRTAGVWWEIGERRGVAGAYGSFGGSAPQDSMSRAIKSNSSRDELKSLCLQVTRFSRRPQSASGAASLRNLTTYVRRLGYLGLALSGMAVSGITTEGSLVAADSRVVSTTSPFDLNGEAGAKEGATHGWVCRGIDATAPRAWSSRAGARHH